jgi:predicted transcriptional regulator
MKRAAKRHLKRDVLGLLARSGSLGHQEIARNANLWPIRAVSTYMRRLERQGLVRSARPHKRVIWQIAEKGRDRLHWFECHPEWPRWLKRPIRRKRIE